MIGCKAEPQQPQLPRAYDIAVAASQYVVLVDAANLVPRLNCALPVAIDGEEWEETAENLDDIFLGDAEIWRRPSSGTANPRRAGLQWLGLLEWLYCSGHFGAPIFLGFAEVWRR